MLQFLPPESASRTSRRFIRIRSHRMFCSIRRYSPFGSLPNVGATSSRNYVDYDIAGQFKMYHLGSNQNVPPWDAGFLIRFRCWLQGQMGAGGDSRLLQPEAANVPLRGGVWGTVVSQFVDKKDITDLPFDAVMGIWASACARLARWRCPGAGNCVR
jgi:hypothetical protein